MSSEVTIQDLPDEMLEKILLHLRLADRKPALRVCKRWSALKPFDSSSVQLILDSDRFYEKDYQEFHRALLASTRRYKHVAVYIGVNFEYYDLLLEILSSFSEGVESLMLNFEPVYSGLRYVGPTTVELSFFAKIAAMSSKLKHLHIDEGVFESDGSDLEFSTMNNVEKLHLKNNLLTLVPNMQDLTPNVTRLSINLRSKESIDFLRRFSTQLVEVEISFKPKNNFLAIFTMQFPLLEKLNLSCIEEDYENAHSDGAMERFIQQLRGLKMLTLRNLDFERVGDLCQLQSCENIQFLCLGMGLDLPLDAYDFRAICKLKHLKRLRIENATVSVPRVLKFPPLKTLHMLSLDTVRITDHSEFFRFRQYAFPDLAVFELCEVYDWDVRDSIKLYRHLCQGMPFMKRLVISDYETNLELGPFLKLCASRRCRELRVKCRDVLDTHPLEELRPIPVEILIMEVSTIPLKTLRKLIESMGALRRLELVLSPFTKPMQPEEIRSLQVAFPRCEVILKPRVQIVEPLW